MKIWQTGLSIIAVCVLFLAITSSQAKKPVDGKFYYFLEEIGILHDEPNMVYEPEMIQAYIENQFGITAELKEIVCQNGILTGYIKIVDQTGNIQRDERNNHEQLGEKYRCTIGYENESENLGGLGVAGARSERNSNTLTYMPRIEKRLGLPLVETPIEINLTGFEEPLVFQLKPAKGYASLSEIGPTVEKNGTSITTITKKTEDGLEISYCVLPSEEVDFANQEQRRSFVYRPYHYDADNMFWATHKDGKRLPQAIWRERGEKITKLDFLGETEELPTELHFGPMTGMMEEEGVAELPIPQMNDTLKINVPAEFSLGSMRFVEVSRSQSQAPEEEGEVLAVKIEFESKDAYRELFSAECDPLSEEDGKILPHGTSLRAPEVYGEPLTVQFTFQELAGETISFNCQHPLYWINETYDVPIKY